MRPSSSNNKAFQKRTSLAQPKPKFHAPFRPKPKRARTAESRCRPQETSCGREIGGLRWAEGWMRGSIGGNKSQSGADDTKYSNIGSPATNQRPQPNCPPRSIRSRKMHPKKKNTPNPENVSDTPNTPWPRSFPRVPIKLPPCPRLHSTPHFAARCCTPCPRPNHPRPFKGGLSAATCPFGEGPANCEAAIL